LQNLPKPTDGKIFETVTTLVSVVCDIFQKEDKKYFKRGDLSAREAEEYFKKSKRFKTDQLIDVCSCCLFLVIHNQQSSDGPQKNGLD